MISAVAARKAALASQNTLETVDGNQPPTSPPRNHKPPGKRKPSSQPSKTQTPKKKARKLKPFEKSNGIRVEDSFKDQTDVIVVDAASEEGSDDSMSMSETSDDGLLSEAARTTNTRGKRAWSPSLPVEDSSDDDLLENAEGGIFDVTDILPHLPSSGRRVDQPEGGGILSTFQPTPNVNLFFTTEDESLLLGIPHPCTLVCLNHEETICVLGTCGLTVLQGSISIYGTPIQPSSRLYPVYAPRSAPLPIIQSIPATLDQSSTLFLSADKLPPRLQPALKFHALIAIQEIHSGVEGLGQICRTFESVFEPNRWQRSNTQTPFQIPGIYMVTHATKDLSPFCLSPSWSEAVRLSTEVHNNSMPGRYIVKGPKNTGKSSFARTLVNRLLGSFQRVAFLECDIGQSEFTPGGMVSLNIISNPLFGPPFTHPTLPNYAHFIGSSTPRSSPSHYLDAISALVQTYLLDIQTPVDDDSGPDSLITDSIPLVVNMMGWVKGLGADLNQKIESLVEPTDVFDIQTSVNEPYPMTPRNASPNAYGAYHSSNVALEETSARVHILEPVASSLPAGGFTAADCRAISILSYFHANFPPNVARTGLGLEQVTATSWDTTNPLCAMPPFEVASRVAFDKVVLTGAGSEDVVDQEISRVLNGALVGLVACQPGTMDIDPNPVEGSALLELGIPYSRQEPPPSPTSSNCVGVALIRGVSPPIPPQTQGPSFGQMSTFFHLLTPLPSALLPGARVVVKGEMELPVWGMLDFRNAKDGKDLGDVADIEADGVPFLQWGKAPEGAIGAEKRRVRRNLMRRGQM